MKNKMQIGRVVRASMLAATVLAVMPSAVGCLDRPVAPSTPRTTNTLTDQVQQSSVDKIDLLFMIDNSASMADKQQILALAVPDLVGRLINPVCGTTDDAGVFTKLPPAQQPGFGQLCPEGSAPEFTAITDIHIGVVTSSLGGHGADICDPTRDTSTKNPDDKGRLLTRSKTGTVQTYQEQGFFAWDPGKKYNPPGEGDPVELQNNFKAVVQGADQNGCGYEASLESWYRFLIDPTPPALVQAEGGKFYKTTEQGTTFASTIVEGLDEVLLQQRADFLRPDSLVAVINLSDENDCSIIDGTLPATVCDDPTFDENGDPNGCATSNVGWPAGYLEGNAQGFTRTGEGSSARVTGSPFPYNHFVAQRIADGSSKWRMAPGTEACATDPYSPECTVSCYPGTPGCTTLTDQEDDNNRRCWDQKRRFGVDSLYPLRRYSDGLTQTKVYDRQGFLVTNPLFDDLPFKAAKKAGTPLSRPRASTRPAPLVFYASIVGVPWQDIANNKDDLTQGYKPATSIDWSLILGNIYGVKDEDKPKDPLMVETNEPRTGTHPITGEALGPSGWNSINGHEYETGIKDLQYACIFQLPETRDCSTGSGSCDCTPITEGDPEDNNPLCEKLDTNKKGDGVRSTTQYSAKAYPGRRFLQVAKDVGANAIVSSICTPNVTNDSSDDFGYRPAVSAIIERLKTQLTARCLPRTLDVNDGVTPCLIIDARLPKDPQNPNDPAEVAKCNECVGGDGNAKVDNRQAIDPAIKKLLTGDVLNYECLCEIKQLKPGGDLDTCQTEKNATLTSTGGWCYIDPAKETNADRKAAQEKVVGKCERQLRFINAGVENTTLFITCLGAASGNEIVTPAASAQTSSISQ